MSKDPSKPRASSAAARSAVTNGSSLFLDQVDGRSSIARRFKDLTNAITQEVGDPDTLTEAQRQLIRRAVTIAIECEMAEARMAQGEAIDLKTYTTAVNSLRRVLVTLGLKLELTKATPSPFS